MDKPFEFICPRCETSLGFLIDHQIVRRCPQCRIDVQPAAGESDRSVEATLAMKKLQAELDALKREYNLAIEPLMVPVTRASASGGSPVLVEPEPPSTAGTVLGFVFLAGLSGFLFYCKGYGLAIPLAGFAIWFLVASPGRRRARYEAYQQATAAFKINRQRILDEMNRLVDG